MTKVKVICSKCNKEYDISLKRYNEKIKRNWNFYCSDECYSNKSSVTLPCSNCGKEVKRTKSQLARSKSGNVFCSRSCATSINNTVYKSDENHPSYINGSGSYRKRALREYDNQCSISLCGWNEDPRILEIHHIDNSHKNSSFDNLVILCPICHRKITLGLYELINRNQLKKLDILNDKED